MNMPQAHDHLENQLARDSIFIIGRVLSVEGRVVKVKVNKNKNHSHIIYKGRVVKNVSVGSYVKIVKGFIEIIGKVEGEFISEEKIFNKVYKKDETKISRTLSVSLFGHFEGSHFKQGIKEMPLLDNECYLLDRNEFDRLHQFAKNSEHSVDIGSLTEEPSQRIRLGVNKLFASHIGIFGNTGSGKSNSLARIFTELFKNYSQLPDFKTKSKFLLIDFNGEYLKPDVISPGKDVYDLSTGSVPSNRKYPISREGLIRLEILSVLLDATEKTQIPFLSRAISNRYFHQAGEFNENARAFLESILRTIIKKSDKSLGVGVFLELFKDLNSLVYFEDINPLDALRNEVETNLHCHSTSGDYYWGASTNDSYDSKTPIYDTHLVTLVGSLDFKAGEFDRLKLIIVLNYFYEITKGYSNQEHIRPLIARMFKKFSMLEKVIDIQPINSDAGQSADEGSNLTVVSLKKVNLEMKKIIPLIICKQAYDQKKEAENRDRSLHIIIDEAHNILSLMSQRESETWKDYRLETFEEIIKEGRKFGTFLTIASQRPHDISPTIISQLHNYFIHRLINDTDINAVQRTIAYLDKPSFESIPILSAGSCFVAGLASDIPVKVDMEFLPSAGRPQSETIDLMDAWTGSTL